MLLARLSGAFEISIFTLMVRAELQEGMLLRKCHRLICGSGHRLAEVTALAASYSRSLRWKKTRRSSPTPWRAGKDQCAKERHLTLAKCLPWSGKRTQIILLPSSSGPDLGKTRSTDANAVEVSPEIDEPIATGLVSNGRHSAIENGVGAHFRSRIDLTIESTDSPIEHRSARFKSTPFSTGEPFAD
ncbi:hypothetical protein NXT3_PB00055 (plasmid) [Sinorhizobium fredii]|uniref:Uncharacterized protein n=1 Tax=Rhizobium fredii TaxID=380 RepID=A0A2L0HBC6_RHIFR|nr:hypothetical protein NXT3_PB00055 [Sinorhizobium fredii]